MRGPVREGGQTHTGGAALVHSLPRVGTRADHSRLHLTSTTTTRMLNRGTRCFYLSFSMLGDDPTEAAGTDSGRMAHGLHWIDIGDTASNETVPSRDTTTLHVHHSSTHTTNHYLIYGYLPQPHQQTQLLHDYCNHHNRNQHITKTSACRTE